MRRLTESKLILVTRPTRVAELKRRFNTGMQAKFYVSHLGQDFSDYEQEDERYVTAVKAAQQVLQAMSGHEEPEDTPEDQAPVRAAMRYLTNRLDHLDYRAALLPQRHVRLEHHRPGRGQLHLHGLGSRRHQRGYHV